MAIVMEPVSAARRRKKASKKGRKKASKKAAKKTTRLVCPKKVRGLKVKKLSNGACMVKPKGGRAKFVKKVRARRGR